MKRRTVLACVAAPGTSGCAWYRLPPAPGHTDAAPQRLSQTGLHADATMTSLAPDVRAFTPSFDLWSDGATKSRFIALPEHARIDTRDMNAWESPVGTRLWKEFAVSGTKVETRDENGLRTLAAWIEGMPR